MNGNGLKPEGVWQKSIWKAFSNKPDMLPIRMWPKVLAEAWIKRSFNYYSLMMALMYFIGNGMDGNEAISMIKRHLYGRQRELELFKKVVKTANRDSQRPYWNDQTQQYNVYGSSKRGSKYDPMGQRQKEKENRDFMKYHYTPVRDRKVGENTFMGFYEMAKDGIEDEVYDDSEEGPEWE